MVLTIEQMKKAEQQAVDLGVSYVELMENAGTMCAFHIVRDQSVLNKDCVILCGNGNNGGDGFVIARRLYEKGASVTVVLVKSMPSTETAHDMFTKIQDKNIEIIDGVDDLELVKIRLMKADIIVDCIFGTGFRGQIVGNIKSTIEMANNAFADIYSVDIPSGINGDYGTGDLFIKPVKTFALGAYKKAHELNISKSKCGEILLLDIGIPLKAFHNLDIIVNPIDENAIKYILPKRNPFSHKGNYGKLLNVVGSVGMGGAAIMCTKSALRCGAGLVTMATPKEVISNGFTQVLEAVSIPLKTNENGAITLDNLDTLQKSLDNSTACLIGCGLSTDSETQTLVQTLLKSSKNPIILDADGINAIASDINILKTVNCNIILTPHLGEMSRLTGVSIFAIEENREKFAKLFATEYGVILVLKGHETIVATPDGKIYKNTTGNAGMSKGGSGDVLAGMIASFVAQGIELEKATILAVYLHGLAGDVCAKKYSEYGMLPTDMINELPLLLAEITK